MGDGCGSVGKKGTAGEFVPLRSYLDDIFSFDLETNAPDVLLANILTHRVANDWKNDRKYEQKYFSSDSRPIEPEILSSPAKLALF
ncbi:MAG: hypothetical protein SWY16_19770 [Cyanobacteriota bacterium]|nr:hypothetical protein [Cyanobacteriota bacterium]